MSCVVFSCLITNGNNNNYPTIAFSPRQCCRFFFNRSFYPQHLDVVSPFQLYFNPTLILRHYQLWRLATTFLFFGPISFTFLFNMLFTYRYCRMLEEGSFRGRSADFVMMFLFGGVFMAVSIFAVPHSPSVSSSTSLFAHSFLHFSSIWCFWDRRSQLCSSTFGHVAIPLYA